MWIIFMRNNVFKDPVLTELMVVRNHKSLGLSWVSDKRHILLNIWWGHAMETLSTLLDLCEGDPPVTGGFPSQRTGNLDFDVFFDVSLNKRLNKPSSCRWFETPWRPLWRHVSPCWMLTSQRFGICNNEKLKTTRTLAFWGYPPPLHDYPYYWFVHSSGNWRRWR